MNSRSRPVHLPHTVPEARPGSIVPTTPWWGQRAAENGWVVLSCRWEAWDSLYPKERKKADLSSVKQNFLTCRRDMGEDRLSPNLLCRRQFILEEKELKLSFAAGRSSLVTPPGPTCRFSSPTHCSALICGPHCSSPDLYLSRCSPCFHSSHFDLIMSHYLNWKHNGWWRFPSNHICRPVHHHSNKKGGSLLVLGPAPPPAWAPHLLDRFSLVHLWDLSSCHPTSSVQKSSSLSGSSGDHFIKHLILFSLLIPSLHQTTHALGLALVFPLGGSRRAKRFALLPPPQLFFISTTFLFFCKMYCQCIFASMMKDFHPAPEVMAANKLWIDLYIQKHITITLVINWCWSGRRDSKAKCQKSLFIYFLVGLSRA